MEVTTISIEPQEQRNSQKQAATAQTTNCTTHNNRNNAHLRLQQRSLTTATTLTHNNRNNAHPQILPC
eukprot:10046731-Ditylum_brightwellii.AAC.1